MTPPPEVARIALCIRELNEDELPQYFALRREVYARSGYLPAGASGLDVDPFDWRCRFLGAFLDAGGGPRLVGGARLITEVPGPLFQAVERLAGPDLTNAEHGFFAERIFEFRPQLARRLYPGQRLVEFGRTVCAEDYRSFGVGKALVLGLHGLALNLGAAYGIACAPAHLVSFYTRLGGVVLNQAATLHQDLTVKAVPLLVDLTRAASASLEAHEAARRLRAGGMLTLMGDPGQLRPRGEEPVCLLRNDLYPQEAPYDWNPPDLTLSHLSHSASLHDETLRDGLQSASVRHPDIVGKLEILQAIADLGVGSANLGMPGAGGKVAADVLRLAEEIAEQKLPLVPCCAARTCRADLDPLLTILDRTGARLEVGLFLGSSRIRQLAEGWDLDHLLRLTEEWVGYAADRGLEVMFVTEDTCRAEPEHLRRLYSTAVARGARRICATDTVGCANPDGVTALIRSLRSIVGPGVAIDWHGHGDRGLGVPNSLAALLAGADRVHATALGIGERCGNTPMELMLLHRARHTGQPWLAERVQGYLNTVARELELESPPAWLSPELEVLPV